MNCFSFDNVPGPSPWFLRPESKTVDGFHWQEAQDPAAGRGKNLLVGPAGPVLALSFYNYVTLLDESSLLIWNQASARSAPVPGLTPPVQLFVIQPRLLSPLGNLDSAFEAMRLCGARIAVGDGPFESLSLATGNVADEISATFPESLRPLEELLILCDSSGIAPRADGTAANLALLVAQPKHATYRLYPQDWFNNSGFDFGYQWVTRVARNPETGRIHGEGIRMDPFVLDDPLRQLAM